MTADDIMEADEEAMVGEPASGSSAKQQPDAENPDNQGEPGETLITLNAHDSGEAYDEAEYLMQTNQEEFSLEALQTAFDTIAIDGFVQIEQLQNLFMSMESHITAAEVEVAVDEVLPRALEGFLVSFDETKAVYERLMYGNGAQGTVQEGVTAGGRVKAWQGRCTQFWSTGWTRCWRTVRMKLFNKNTSTYSSMKPTTRILIVITSVTSVIAVSVATLGMIFMWVDSVAATKGALVRKAQLIKNALVLFAHESNYASYESNMEFSTSLLGDVVKETGYKSAIQIYQTNLLSGQQVLATTIHNQFYQGSLKRVQTYAEETLGWLETLWDIVGEQDVIKLVNLRNKNTMPPGHEIVMGRWKNGVAGSGITFLTDLRYKHLCRGGKCGSDPTAAAPMLGALGGSTGSLVGNDYRPTSVIAGYAYMAMGKIGIVYKIDFEVLKEDYVVKLKDIVNEANINRRNTLEIVLARLGPQQELVWLSDLIFCEGCNVSAWVAEDMQLALKNQSEGVMVVNDYRPALVLSGYGPIPALGVGVAVQIDLVEVQMNLARDLAASLDSVNGKINRTEEMGFAMKTNNNISVLTNLKFRDQCANGTDCSYDLSEDGIIRRAVEKCESGVARGLDYRGVAMTIGYYCIPYLDGTLFMKVDNDQVQADGVELARNFVNNENQLINDTTQEIIMAVRKDGVAAEDVNSPKDFSFLTKLKYKDQCHPNCGGSPKAAAPMINALRETTGLIQGPDYRLEEVLASYDYIHEMGMGLVVKVDASEVQAPAVAAAIKLFFICFGAVFLCVLGLTLVIKRMLDSIERAWVEGKAAVEHEKQQFYSLVKAMYPLAVAERLLVGETEIVYSVPHTAVFFSDIYQFTQMSNSISADELIQFMGYAYGVMDSVAENLRVYKVKTIGDAYLAVAGLPGSETKNCCLDMLKFACWVAQIFSRRFNHPNSGEILAHITAKNVMQEKKKKRQSMRGDDVTSQRGRQSSTWFESVKSWGTKASGRGASVKGSVIDGDMKESIEAPDGPNDSPTLPKENTTIAKEKAEAVAKNARCIMRYGIAAGPITAGVLQGKTPMFDVWGKTVNLASRMESTGQPGRIQVSDGVYKAVISDPDSTFTFEGSHKTFAKGFGGIPAYFVKESLEPPPKALLQALQLEPNYPEFYFDNPITGGGNSILGSETSGTRNAGK
eukprot:CAMPEP_0174379242 /NCGR_PEP_ID=MMETSP0811_2-20130205/122584_1 /TAXON_ID=73025 ORGANISM="Eutreptiella gymnastica-like, Strain CCMP1594" /NCGR_SAMPLE_ID=MMETSP0811_2 /ASSEMBLY_ACC=CAM_ASM_000667 /LENGTH=1177 /DNA_ID=CAMNT_0015531721 /DNA_START=78 /DNA_END=3611 /DNA_ORIENTATION=-